MALLKNHYINLAIVISGIINATVGGILIYSSFQGHSSFGIISGALIPLSALAFYGDGYGKYKNLEISKDILKKIFKPSIKIAFTLLTLMIVLISWIGFTDNQLHIDLDYLYFFLIILLIFLVPNLIIQIGFYYYLKRKIK